MGATGGGGGATPPPGEPPLGAALAGSLTSHGSAFAAWATARSPSPHTSRQAPSALQPRGVSTSQWWSALQHRVRECLQKQGGVGGGHNHLPPLQQVTVAWLPYGAPVLVCTAPPPHFAEAAAALPTHLLQLPIPLSPLDPPPVKRGDAPIAHMTQYESWQLQRFSCVDMLLSPHAGLRHIVTQTAEAEAGGGGLRLSPPWNAYYPPSHIPLSGVSPADSVIMPLAVDGTEGAYQPALPVPPVYFLQHQHALHELLLCGVPPHSMFSPHGMLAVYAPPCDGSGKRQRQGGAREQSQGESEEDGIAAWESDVTDSGASQGKAGGGVLAAVVAGGSTGEAGVLGKRPRRQRQSRQLLGGAFLVLRDDLVGPDGELLE
jgi:hypothetical protein